MLRLKKILPFIVLFVWVIACNEEEPEVLSNDPLIDIQLFNIDSLTIVNDSLLIVTDSLVVLGDSLLILNDSSVVLTDSISALSVLIEEGQTDLEDQRVLLESILEDFAVSIELLDDQESIVALAELKLDAIVATIESGSVEVSIIENVLNSQVLNYSDSMTVYELPLSMTADSSMFNLYVSDFVFSLTVGYERTQNLDENDRIEIQASQFKVLRHSFDSVTVNCKTSSCIDEDTIIKLYF